MAESPARLIEIGTHSLALYMHGNEPSTPSTLVILFVSGVASSRLVWAPVVRQLGSSIRSYTYDRSGFARSMVSPLPPTAENIAQELDLMIRAADIRNPLILVGHSWAGVIIMEYLARAGTDKIAGLVLVDANHEKMPLVLDVNDPVKQQLFAGVEPYSGMGIEAEHRMTDAEWTAFRQEEGTEQFRAAAEKEDVEYGPSFEILRLKGLAQKQPLLNDKPVYVIGGMRSRDWSNLYEASIARGFGTLEQQQHVARMIETADMKSESLMREFLKLSSKSKLVFARESGHFVQLTQPEVVADGIRWVMQASL